MCRPLRHFAKHVAYVEVGKVGADLGQIQAEFGHGPKTKFALLDLLYNFD
jgi:hypothetical protein